MLIVSLSIILHMPISNGSLVIVIKEEDEYKFRAPPFAILYSTKIVTPHVTYPSKI
jgi:hypothetical protein